MKIKVWHLACVIMSPILVPIYLGVRGDGREISREPVGTTLVASPVSTSLFEDMKTSVSTTGGTFVVRGAISVLRGRRADLVHRSAGYFLAIDGQPTMYRVTGY